MLYNETCKKIPWAHSTITKLKLSWSSMKWLLVFHVNPRQVSAEALNPTYLACSHLNMVLHFLSPICHNSKMVLLYSFQNSVKPKTQHDCGWWNSAMCYRKKKKAKLRQSCSLVCGYCPSGRWPQPCVRPRRMHAVGFYPAPGSTYVLGRRHVLPQFT